MADVPDHAVARRIEQIMQRDGQLDHAEAGAEMAAGDRHGVDRLLAQFVGELAQLISSRRRGLGVDLIEQRRFRRL
jgi:hypothetical protein